MSVLLQASGITKRFGNLTAVAGIDFTVLAGECVAFLGPNGAGKTTTVEMLEGLLDPDGGDIRIFGMSLKAERRAIQQRMGVVLQETKLYKKFTVRETLALFASFFDSALDPDQIIAQLGLLEKTHARLEQLSGGQRQRVYLGCGLINDPTLLFLDEPTTGLDPQARRMIWDVLASFKGSQRGILLTTHAMDEAEKLADRVLIIDHGKIIAEGSPSELIRKVCGEQVLTFTFQTDLEAARATLAPRLAWMSDCQSTPWGLELVTTEPVRRIEELYGASQEHGLILSNLEMRRATLEDVFLKLTGRSIRDDQPKSH